MERRDWSLEALKELQYADSLDDELKASRLEAWVQKYLTNSSIEDFDLPIEELKTLSELFYKNILFLKKHNAQTQEQLVKNAKIKQFFS